MKTQRRSRDTDVHFLEPRLYVELDGRRHAPAALHPVRDQLPVL